MIGGKIKIKSILFETTEYGNQMVSIHKCCLHVFVRADDVKYIL